MGRSLSRWASPATANTLAPTGCRCQCVSALKLSGRGGNGAGVVLPSGDLLVCGVEGAGGVAKGIVCIASTDARAWAVRGRVPLPGANGVALTAVSGAVVIAAHTPTGLFTAMSSPSAAGASFGTGGAANPPNWWPLSYILPDTCWLSSRSRRSHSQSVSATAPAWHHFKATVSDGADGFRFGGAEPRTHTATSMQSRSSVGNIF